MTAGFRTEGTIISVVGVDGADVVAPTTDQTTFPEGSATPGPTKGAAGKEIIVIFRIQKIRNIIKNTKFKITIFFFSTIKAIVDSKVNA